MPGAGVMHRVCWLKVCLAVLWLGLGLPLLSGGGLAAAAGPGIADFRSGATPPLAGQQWSPPRKSSQNSAETTPAASRNQCYPGYNNLLQFLAGGFLGGVLWSILFGYPVSLCWSQGQWLFGLLDAVAVTTIVYMGYRLLRQTKPKETGIPIPGFRMPETLAPPVFSIRNEAGPGLAQICQADPGFELSIFVESARQMIFDLHEAWNHEDLEKIKDRVTERMLEFLRMGLKIIGLREEISRMEDLSLSQIVVAMAEQKENQERITVIFEGRVVDYLLDRRNFKLVSGSMTYPERLHEYWIFERERGRSFWLLADIHDSRILPEHEVA